MVQVIDPKLGFKTAALFAGIGGVELGLGRSGHSPILFCENDEAASHVLKRQFSNVPLVQDVKDLTDLPKDTELLTAGFPCQDLSQAGKTAGISGARSGLVGEVFRLLEKHETPHLLLENVPFMLQLDRGQAMVTITSELERLGYSWAYRVLDSRAFGLPQRRQRVFLFASKFLNPSELLFQTDKGEQIEEYKEGVACGFYWTEGVRGLGWAVNAIPTLKSGSTIGIPSPPAIWLPDGRIVKPEIRDAERLQGFDVDWTLPATEVTKSSARWRLAGNAVSVNTAEWIGKVILASPKKLKMPISEFDQNKSWPRAAFGGPGLVAHSVLVSMWPVAKSRQSLESFLEYEPDDLSLRATKGFRKRLEGSSLKREPAFFDALLAHERRQEKAVLLL